jgi:hypothetical protein
MTTSLLLVEACADEKLVKIVSLYSAFCRSDVYKNQDAWVVEAAILTRTKIDPFTLLLLTCISCKVLRVLSEALEYLNYPRDHPHTLGESRTIN